MNMQSSIKAAPKGRRQKTTRDTSTAHGGAEFEHAAVKRGDEWTAAVAEFRAHQHAHSSLFDVFRPIHIEPTGMIERAFRFDDLVLPTIERVINAPAPNLSAVGETMEIGEGFFFSPSNPGGNPRDGYEAQRAKHWRAIRKDIEDIRTGATCHVTINEWRRRLLEEQAAALAQATANSAYLAFLSARHCGPLEATRRDFRGVHGMKVSMYVANENVAEGYRATDPDWVDAAIAALQVQRDYLNSRSYIPWTAEEQAERDRLQAARDAACDAHTRVCDEFFSVEAPLLAAVAEKVYRFAVVHEGIYLDYERSRIVRENFNEQVALLRVYEDLLRLSDLPELAELRPVESIADWDTIIATLDVEVPILAKVARDRRSEGSTPHRFLNDCLSAFERGRQSDALNEVFELSKADKRNLSEQEIIKAWKAIKAGETAASAYARVGLASKPARPPARRLQSAAA